MPSDSPKHTPGDPIAIRPDTNNAKVLKLLYQDTNLGYTLSELQHRFNMPYGSTSTTLSQLQEDDYIRKTSDGLYYGFEHRADLSRFATSLVQLDTLFTRYPEIAIDPEDIEQTDEVDKEAITDE